MARAVYRTELQKVVNGVLVPVANGEATIYEAGTTTPIVATMYQGATGGATFSNPLTADADGTIQFFLDLPQAIKLVATATGLGTITVDHQLVLVDQATLATLNSPTITGQAKFADGSAAAPSITFTSDPDVGFYRAGANLLGLPAGGATSFVWDATAVPAGPRAYISEAALTKTALLLGRGDTAAGVTPDTGSWSALLLAQSFQAGAGEAIKGAAYGSSPQASAGFITGLAGVAQASAAGTWTPPGAGVHGFIGVLGYGQAYKTGARVWGGNLLAQQHAGNGSTLTGLEIDIESRSGATVQDRYGIQIVTASDGANAGTNEDIALKFANKNSTEANRWKVGIAFHSPDGAAGTDGWPIRTTGDMIKAYGTGISAASGIDFSAVAFSGNSLDLPKFRVKGNGRVSINTNSQTGEAPLFIDAAGETYPLRIDGFTVHPTAGASAGYIQLRSGSTTYKIELLANS